MNVKLTNFTIVNMINVLNKFAEKKLPQKISYAITRNLILLQSDYDCYAKSLNKLFSEYKVYFVKDGDGNTIKNDIGIPIVEESVSNVFNDELSSLLNIEIETALHQIPKDVFDYKDEAGRFDPMSAKDIMNLQAVLCGNNSDEEPEKIEN